MSGSIRPEYDPTCYAPLVAVEDRHFWFRARNRAIATLVRQVTRGLSPGYGILEVGCGTGNVLRALTLACPDGTVVGMDLLQDGLMHARARMPGALLVRGDALRPPFGGSFEVVGMFDVLEHITDDLGVLRSLHSLVAVGGALMITVPASPALWSYFDEAALHVRRYELAELNTKLQQAGFTVEYISPYMATLYPVLWLGRRIASRGDRRSATDPDRTRDLFNQELRINPIAGAVLGAVLAQELPWLRRRRRLPAGSSLIAIARRPSERSVDASLPARALDAN